MPPGYSDEARSKLEDARDRCVNDGAFTAAFRKVFSISHQSNPEETGSLEFALKDIYSSSDHKLCACRIRPETPVRLYSKSKGIKIKFIDLWSFRFCYSYIGLEDNHGL